MTWQSLAEHPSRKRIAARALVCSRFMLPRAYDLFTLCAACLVHYLPAVQRAVCGCEVRWPGSDNMRKSHSRVLLRKLSGEGRY